MVIEFKEVKDKSYNLNYINGKLSLMSEYEFVYLLGAGFKWKRLIEEIGEENIAKFDDKLKIEKFPKLARCIKNLEYDIYDVELGTKRKNPFPAIIEEDEIAVKSISKYIN